jgi:hypothetical protein
MATQTISKVRARLGLGDTWVPWWTNGTSTGHSAPVQRGHDQAWTYVGAVLAGAAGAVSLYVSLLFYRAWQDYSSVLVQAVTGRSGTIYGLLTLVFLASSGALFYTAWWLWTDRGNWHRQADPQPGSWYAPAWPASPTDQVSASNNG